MSDSRVRFDEVKPAEISPDMLARLDELPGSEEKPWTARFSAEDDAILLKYWGVKKQSHIAEIIGYSMNTCRKRYRKLRGEE